VTRGVRESSSRGYVPLLLTVGGQPLDSLGFPAGVCASEAGVFGDATHRSHSSRPPSKGFSRPSKMEPRIHAMRANSGARRQIVRQQGRSVAKTREASPRYATSCRDLVRRSRKAEPHESEERLQSSEREASPRVSSLQSEGVLGRGDPCLSRGMVRESVLVGCDESPRNSARAARSRRQAPEAVRDARRREQNARQRPAHGSTEARTAT
jgi:hypothetical protein